MPEPDRAAPPAHHPHPGRLLAFLLLVALAALLVLSAGLHERIVAAVALLRDTAAAHPFVAALLFVLLAALSAMLVLFSGALLVPVGIEAWGTTACFLLLWAGWWLGGLLTYALGRAFGRPAVERLLPAATVARYEGRIGEQLPFAGALVVLLSLPSDVIGYFFGLVRYRPGRYLLALLLAELPYAWGTVFLGAAFLDRQLAPLLGGALVAAGVFAWQRWMRRRA